jgi:uncharacterized protein HemX
MTLNRLTVGAMFGAAVAFFFDPDQGEARRERLKTLWRDNQDTIDEARRKSEQAVQSIDPLAKRIRRTVAGARERPSAGAKSGFGLGALLAASAVGAGIAYFGDPSQGAGRRRRLFDVWQETQHEARTTGSKVVSKAANALPAYGDDLRGQARKVAGGAKNKLG